MADLLKFELDQDSFAAFGRRFRSAKLKNVQVALGNIRAEWQREYGRQQQKFSRDGTWPEYSDDYRARKTKEYYRHKRHGPNAFVRYLTMLKRSGRMLDGYIQNVKIDEVNYTVTAGYPGGREGRYALVHQGIERTTEIPPPRPFDLHRFRFVADREIRRALK